MKRAQTQGAQRHKLSSVLASQLPHMSASDISRHETWYRALRANSDRKKLITQSYEQQREALLGELRESVDAARQRAREEAVLAEELERQERAR